MKNKVILIGNVGSDPEKKKMPDDSTVTNIALATTRRWKDKQTGEKKTETEWHNVTFFNQLADIVCEYVKKGRQLYIEGRIRTRKYTDKNGDVKYRTDILASEMQMLGSPRDPNNSDKYSNPDQAAQQAGNVEAPAGDDFDNEIPY